MRYCYERGNGGGGSKGADPKKASLLRYGEGEKDGGPESMKLSGGEEEGHEYSTCWRGWTKGGADATRLTNKRTFRKGVKRDPVCVTD